jgi:RNA polymerase sigma factor (sigma-70 family)
MDGKPSTAGATGPAGTAAPALTREELERVRARDRDALALLFDRCFDRVYALARRLTGQDAAAEDVTQEVFLKVYRSAHTLDPGRDPAPWLATITYNACRERWRSRSSKQARRSVPLDDGSLAAAPLVAGGENPERRTIENERAERVAHAVESLDEPLRTVVVLHDYEGLAHAEIATIVGARETAVRKRYSRALAQLREHLKDVLE